MKILSVIYNQFLLNPVVSSLLSGFFGAVIGGVATCQAAEIAHKNNLKLEQQKIKEEERAVVLSIAEEIKTIKEIYEPLMDKYFSQLTAQDSYLDSYYIVTQDFFTVYSNNASKLGLIKDDELRNKIVKIYIYMKKFLEDFNILKLLHDDLSEKKAVFNELIKVSNELKNGYKEIKSVGNEILDIINKSETNNERI